MLLQQFSKCLIGRFFLQYLFSSFFSASLADSFFNASLTVSSVPLGSFSVFNAYLVVSSTPLWQILFLQCFISSLPLGVFYFNASLAVCPLGSFIKCFFSSFFGAPWGLLLNASLAVSLVPLRVFCFSVGFQPSTFTVECCGTVWWRSP